MLNLSKKKIKGFTLIELIVVIAIIGILAAILVPSMLGYVKIARIRRYNSNAKSVYSGAQLAITDRIKSNQLLQPNTIYLCTAAGDGRCVAQGANGEICDITDYIGTEFKGYFGFYTNNDGSCTDFAVWSEKPVTAADLQTQFSETTVKARFENNQPIGCHPLVQNAAASST